MCVESEKVPRRTKKQARRLKHLRKNFGRGEYPVPELRTLIAQHKDLLSVRALQQRWKTKAEKRRLVNGRINLLGPKKCLQPRGAKGQH